jgi:hypothetical protein
MQKFSATAGFVGLALAVAIGLALLSAYVERVGPELVEYGNMCGPETSAPCYQPVLKGGFPIAYLFDAPGVSVKRQLSFGEDNFSGTGLMLNIGIYFCFVLLVMSVASRYRPASHRKIAP